MRCPRELLRCGVQHRCLCALHRARRGFSRSIAQHARVFVGGHNPAFPRFSCGGSCRFLCGPRNAVQMAGGNRGPASRPRIQSIEIESELTNTHLNLTETRRRPVEEPDARGAQRELPPSHQRRGSQGETKFQPRDPHPPNVMSRGTRNHRLTRLPRLPLDPARAVRHRPEAAMPRTRHHALAVPQGASRPQNTPGPSVAAKRPRYPPSAANGNFFSLGCRLPAADARVPPDPIRSGEETR